MEDRERTQVAPIHEDDSLTGSPVPPQISIHPEPEAREHSMAAGGGGFGGEAAMDEPSWRPSAASALASLAAEELASASSSIASKRDDIAVGAALPATSDALEKLLAGDRGSTAATQFGAAEMSESAVRPLPRRAEAITSVPLRDPVVNRRRNGWMWPVSILGAAAMLTVGVVWALSGNKTPAPPPDPVAMVTPPPPAQPVPLPARETAPVTPPPAEAAAPPNPAEAKAALAVAGVNPESVKADGKSNDKNDDDDDDKEARKKKSGKKKRERPAPRPRHERREPADTRPPPPPRRPHREPTDVDDLLAPGEQRPSRRTAAIEEDTPRQLDDGDILKVLRNNRKAIIDCVKKQQASDGSVSGTMMVNMVITKAGQATRITVSPDRYTRTVAGKCVSSAVKSWKFPHFSGPNMPIDFPVRIR